MDELKLEPFGRLPRCLPSSKLPTSDPYEKFNQRSQGKIAKPEITYLSCGFVYSGSFKSDLAVLSRKTTTFLIVGFHCRIVERKFFETYSNPKGSSPLYCKLIPLPSASLLFSW